MAPPVPRRPKSNAAGFHLRFWAVVRNRNPKSEPQPGPGRLPPKTGASGAREGQEDDRSAPGNEPPRHARRNADEGAGLDHGALPTERDQAFATKALDRGGF